MGYQMADLSNFYLQHFFSKAFRTATVQAGYSSRGTTDKPSFKVNSDVYGVGIALMLYVPYI